MIQIYVIDSYWICTKSDSCRNIDWKIQKVFFLGQPVVLKLRKNLSVMDEKDKWKEAVGVTQTHTHKHTGWSTTSYSKVTNCSKTNNGEWRRTEKNVLTSNNWHELRSAAVTKQVNFSELMGLSR